MNRLRGCAKPGLSPAQRQAGRQPPRLGETRPPLARIQEIRDRIQSGAYPNCVELAAEFELSVPTLKRDLVFMKDRLRLPIAYDARRHGYYFSRPVEASLPMVEMSEAELFALLVADKAIAQYHGTPFHQPLQTAFRKLTRQLEHRVRFSLANLDDALSFRPFAPEDTDLETFRVITRALREGRTIQFRYRNLGMSSVLVRRVQPYHLACIDNHWYLFAYDPLRQDIRTFALSRLRAPLLTRERFTRPRDFNPDAYLGNSLTVLKGHHDYAVTVELDAWATDLVRRRRWHPKQELIELPSGVAQLRFRLSSLDEIERLVLTWGTHATVVRPQALIDRLARITSELSDRYRRLAAE